MACFRSYYVLAELCTDMLAFLGLFGGVSLGYSGPLGT